MTAKSSPSLRSIAVLLVAGAALAGAGCGRRADPELPTVQKAVAPSPVGIPVGPSQPTAPASKPAVHKPFALDPLL